MSARSVSVQRTGLEICRTSTSTISAGSVCARASTALRYGIAGARTLSVPSFARSLSPAPRIRLLWEGTLTGKVTARLAPRVFATSIARRAAAASPAMTTWPGQLKLTASTTPLPAASRHTAITASSSRPRIAAMAPLPAGTASCMT